MQLSIPAYRSEEAKLNNEDPLTIMDWDEDREMALLSPGAEVPTNRSGSLVFADRTVYRTSRHGHSMFSISDELLDEISKLREQRREMLEDVYS